MRLSLLNRPTIRIQIVLIISSGVAAIIDFGGKKKNHVDTEIRYE